MSKGRDKSRVKGRKRLIILYKLYPENKTIMTEERKKELFKKLYKNLGWEK